MTIKTAILGYGRNGSSLHAGQLVKMGDEFTVTAVCDIDPEACQKAKERFNCTTYTDYKTMLNNEKLDFVIIVTRSDQHCEMTCDCLRAGVNVMVTKPWCLDKSQALKMIAAEKESRMKLLPWLPARWGCDYLKIKELVDSGIIGKVFMIRRREFYFGVRCDWQTLKKYGGGYLLNWGPHIVYQALQLCGEEIKSVYAQMRQIVNPGDVEDVFNATMTTESGVIISCEYAVAADKLPNWVIQGDKGTIFVKEKSIEIHTIKYPDELDVTAYRNDLEVTILDDRKEGNHRIPADGNRFGDPAVVYPVIAQGVRGDIEYPVSTASALRLTEILDAIRHSSAENQVIHL